MKSNLLKKVPKVGTLGRWVGAGATIKIYSSWATKLFYPVLSLFCQYQVHMHFRPQGAIYREIGFFCPLLKHTYWDASSAISAAKRRGLQKVYKPAQVSFFVQHFFSPNNQICGIRVWFFKLALVCTIQYYPILPSTYTILHIPSDPTNSTTALLV